MCDASVIFCIFLQLRVLPEHVCPLVHVMARGGFTGVLHTHAAVVAEPICTTQTMHELWSTYAACTCV
jgi:hypothetical protein